MAKSVTSLVLFIIPSEKVVNGGVMSIFSLTKETRELFTAQQCAVELCVYPGDVSYHTNDLFENTEYIYDFEAIIEKYPKLSTLLLHIPELAIDKMNTRLAKYMSYLESIPSVHINILNQNIWHMHSQHKIAALYKYANHITQTTAHERYSSQEVADEYALALKHLSVFIDSSQYTFLPYSKKQNVIAYSRDKHEMRESVLELLRESLPEYTLVEINNMTYEEYKTAIASAKYVLTFGEGLDGYLIESTFSGSIAISTYNSDFFPDESFKKEAFIYNDYTSMLKDLIVDIKQYDEPKRYEATVKSMYKKLGKIYMRDTYLNNLADFYSGSIDFTPSYASMEKLMSTQVRKILKDGDGQRQQITTLQEQLLITTKNIKHQADIYKSELVAIKQSRSWQVTKPLRQLSQFLKNLVK